MDVLLVTMTMNFIGKPKENKSHFPTRQSGGMYYVWLFSEKGLELVYNLVNEEKSVPPINTESVF